MIGRRRMDTVALVLAACAIVLSACSATGTSVTATSSTTPITATAGNNNVTQLQAVLAGIAPDGSTSVAVARQLFQLAYGGLQDVGLPAGDPSPAFDGTIALTAMNAHRNELSSADRSALDAVIAAGAPVSATLDSSGGRSGGPDVVLVAAHRSVDPKVVSCPAQPGYGKPLPASDPEVADLKERAAAWEQRIGVAAEPLGIPVNIIVYKAAGPVGKGGTADADTFTFDAACGGGKPAVCQIRFFAGTLEATDADRDNIVAHELWHCFEAVIVGDRDRAFNEPNWIIEGESEWVGDFESGAQDEGWWRRYLRTPSEVLFKSAYSAVGFYASMDSDGAQMFPALRDMLVKGEGGSVAAFGAAVAATGGRLLETWGPRYFQDPSRYSWNYSHPTGDPPPTNLADDIPLTNPVAVSDGFTHHYETGPYSVALFVVHTTTDFVHVSAPGHASALDATNSETDGLADTWFCTHSDPEQCKCPEGSSGKAPNSTPADGDLRVAVTATDGPGPIDIAGASLEHFCEPPQTGNDTAFCADAKNLQTITQANLDAGLVSRLAQQAQADRQWTAKMDADAPASIATAMEASAAAYAAADTAEASVGYQVVGGPDVINAIHTATQAVAAVHAQNQQIEQYVNSHCGFTFQFA